MKKGWEIKTLADICTFENGDRGVNYPSKAKRTSTGIPFINAGHFVDNKIDFTNMDYISRERYNLMGSGKIQKGDILFCLRGSLGKFASVENLPEGQIASSLVIVRPSELVSHEYLLAYFESYLCEENIERYRGGAAQPNLSAKSLTQFTIPIPPLPEQQRIVSVLDEAFASIAQAKSNAERNLVNSRELFEALLNEYFGHARDGWKEMTLNDACIVERGSSPRPIKKYQTTSEDGVNWIKIGDTKGVEKYIYSTREKITRAGAEKSRFVKEGDFILTNSMSFGNPYIMKTEGYIHDGWFVLRLKESIDTEFFWFLLVSPFVQNQFNQLASGAIVKNISGDLVKKAKLFIPPLAEQRAIVGRLEALSAETGRLEEIYQQKVESLEELKRSVLQKAFNGEL